MTALSPATLRAEIRKRQKEPSPSSWRSTRNCAAGLNSQILGDLLESHGLNSLLREVFQHPLKGVNRRFIRNNVPAFAANETKTVHEQHEIRNFPVQFIDRSAELHRRHAVHVQFLITA